MQSATFFSISIFLNLNKISNQMLYLLLLSTAESQFLELLRETTIGSRNRESEISGVKLQ